jgi:hypothetical protein
MIRTWTLVGGVQAILDTSVFIAREQDGHSSSGVLDGLRTSIAWW